MKSYCVTIQMKPLQQYFHMVLFNWNVVLTFESVDENLWCYHSNETFSAVFLHGFKPVEIKPVVFADGQENY